MKVVEHRTIFEASPSSAYTIPSWRHLYLDTSIVRRLGTKLWDCPRAAESYTSVLTLIELMNGLCENEKQFRIRKSAIAGLMASEVAIDWQMPDVRLRCAFSELRPKYDIYEKRTECIQKLLTCLATCERPDEFRSKQAALGLEYGWEHFARMDEEISRGHINAAKKWVPYNREQFHHPATPEFLAMFGLPPDAPIHQAAQVLGGSDFDFGLGLYALTKKFMAEEGLHGFEVHDRLFRSYDGSVDLYIRAESHQIWRENGRNDMPGRNTGLDLTHLLYVAAGSYVVTTDDGMASATLQAGGAVIGEREFNTSAAG